MDRENPAASIRFFLALLVVVAAAALPVPGTADTSSDPAMHLRKGDDLLLRKLYHEALVEYETALAGDPYNSIAWNKLGIAHMRTGRYGDAELAFEKAIALDPHYTEAWTNMGDSRAALGDHQKAIEAYDRALGINQRDMYALLRKGISLQETGDSTQAMAVYQEVIRLADWEMRKHPNYASFDAEIWTNKGEALSRLGRYEEAVDSFNTALEINPKLERAKSGKVRALDTILLARSNPDLVVPVTVENTSQSIPTIVPVPAYSVIGALLGAGALMVGRRLQQKP